MEDIKNLFEIENAKSDGYENYDKGNIIFVTNGDYDSSVLGKVKPMGEDKVFHQKSICLSSFCEPTIQNPPFLPRGNGGSGLVVLVPKQEMSNKELYFYASQIKMERWRFSFGRMLIKRRVMDLKLVMYSEDNLKINVEEEIDRLLPPGKPKKKINENKHIKLVKVDKICNIKKKTSLPQNAMNMNGKIPYVTASSLNNGVSDFADEEPNFEGKCLTVALNGSVGEVFFQTCSFITSGDNAVLTLKTKGNNIFLFYIGALIKNNQWRYNYYRKLNLNKLKNLEVPLPYDGEEIDYQYIEKIVKNSYGFSEIERNINLHNSKTI